MPESGSVTCPDWNPKPECGGGLHFLLWGIGDYSLLDDKPDDKWLIIEADESTIVDLGGKVKAPRATVLFAGDCHAALRFLDERTPDDAVLNGKKREVTRGLRAATASGYLGQATASGKCLAVSLNDTASLQGVAGACLIASYWDSDAKRPRVVVAYVGENGIEANVPYRLNERHEFVAVK